MKWRSGQRHSFSDWRSFQKHLGPSRFYFLASPKVLKIFGLFCLVLIACGTLLFAAKRTPPSRSSPSISPNSPSRAKDLNQLSFPLSTGLPRFDRIVDGLYEEERDSYRFRYSLSPILQMSIMEILHTYRPPYGAFVALDPKTGRILALADYSRQNPWNAGLWQRATYPAASIFKIITAAAALEKGLLNYDSPVSYRGNQYRLGPQKIAQSSRRDRQMSFDEAFGKSNNVVFGRVASHLVGSETLRKASEAFGFNQSLSFDFPLEISQALIPDETYELARCGAGFGEVTLNPLHAALIAAGVANRGIMMRPYLAAEIWDANGECLYVAKPQVLFRPISAQTAADLSQMMLRTVQDGTAARIFHRYGKALTNRLTICGKTGSLTGDNPPGKYDWFIGFASAEEPQIAFSAMMVNQDRGRIRSAWVAQEVLRTFFRESF